MTISMMIAIMISMMVDLRILLLILMMNFITTLMTFAHDNFMNNMIKYINKLASSKMRKLKS